MTFTATPLEKVREYWDRRPCNIRHSTKETGTREYFDEVEARKYRVEPHIPGFADFERWKGKRVLEIGCGIGTDTINFARAGAHVTAVDLSEKSIAIARRRAEVYGLSGRVRFFCGDAESLGDILPDGTYDLIYSFGVIHHTPHPERVIHQLKRFAHRGTTVKVMVYHRRSWKVFWIILRYGWGRFWRAEELVARHSEAQTGCPVTFTYTPREMPGFLNGFKVVDTRIEHIFPYRIRDYVNYRYVRNWYFRRMPPRLFEMLEKRWGWHLCVTAEAP